MVMFVTIDIYNNVWKVYSERQVRLGSVYGNSERQNLSRI
jgi:hypothetical protein